MSAIPTSAVASPVVSPSSAPMAFTRPDTAGAGTLRRDLGRAVEPLPPLNQVLPEHIAYVRSVVARFSVTPTHWREDLVQEVLIEAHRSRDSHLDVRALLFGITRHVVSRWRAKQEVERAVVALCAGPQACVDGSLDEECREAQLRRAVRAAIDELPDLFREVFVRTHFEQMSMPDVARELGISLNTGYTRLYLARGRFLESLLRLVARLRIEGGDLL